MTQENQPAPAEEQWGQEPEECFSDVFWSHINPWSCVITFGLRRTKEDEKDTPTIRMRMPLQQAKALAVVLLRSIRSYEQQTQADIDLPQQVLKALDIAPEDWERFKGA